MATVPALLARGVLSQTSLPEILVSALDREQDGTLVLQSADGEKSAIQFVRGSPAKSRSPHDGLFLADVIVDLGLVDRSASQRTRAKAEEFKKTHGEILLDEHLLDETSLYLALREQLQRQVLVLCSMPPETQFGLYDANLLAKWGGPGEWRVKPLPLIWRALADHLPAARVAQLVSELADRPLHMRFESPVSRYRMNSTESSLVDLIRAKAQTVASLEASGIGRADVVRRFAAALMVSRQIEGLADDREPVGLSEPPETPASLPPPSQGRRGATERRRSISPSGIPQAPGRTTTPTGRHAVDPAVLAQAADSAEFRKEIEAARDQPAATFYQLLGVAENADAAALRAAFFKLARRWHPDRLPPELEDLRPVVTKTFARMGEANQVLNDPVRRAEYDKARLSANDGEQEKVIEILEAASAYQRAEIMLKRRDFAGAHAQAKLAYELDATQADHVALYAWLEANQKPSAQDEMLKLLDHAAELDAMNVRVLWHRGQLLKKMGKVMPAIRDFRAIVELKPNHVDAQRELRVYDMRRRTDNRSVTQRPETTSAGRAAPGRNERTTTAPKPGLIGRLLKKD